VILVVFGAASQLRKTGQRILSNNYDRGLKTIMPFEYIREIETIEPERFTLNPTHQKPGPNIWPLAADGDWEVGSISRECCGTCALTS
jgi:hypothetical protein